MKNLSIQKVCKDTMTYTIFPNCFIDDLRLNSVEKDLLLYLYRKESVIIN